MKLYPDSMLWIYLFEKNPQFYAAVHAFMLRSQAANHTLLSSYLVSAELLVGPKRTGDLFTAARYRRFFNPANISMVPLSATAAERFADLRATTRVQPADAMHLALAASANADYFVTTDAKLHALSLPGIGRICVPSDVT